MSKLKYGISEIFFEKTNILLKIINFQTGEDFIVDVNERDRILEIINYFKCAKDVLAIGYLQSM